MLDNSQERRSSMFINYSNHPSIKWQREQALAAEEMGGEILDVPFPNVPVTYSDKDILALAYEEADKITSLCPKNAVVMCQGEFTLCYAVVSILQNRDIQVVSATTERKTVERIEDGTVIKTAEFHFAGFREYCRV